MDRDQEIVAESLQTALEAYPPGQLLALAIGLYSAIFISITATQKPHSIYRPVGLAAITVLIGLIVCNCISRLFTNKFFLAVTVSTATLQWLKCCNDLCAVGISFAQVYRTSAERFAAAADMLWNYRGIGTPWQITSKLPLPKKPVNGRLRFVLSHGLWAVVCILLMDLASSAPPPTPEFFQPENEALFSRLGDVTSDEMINRMATTAVFWLHCFMICSATYSLAACISVALFLSSPRMWPPVFGPFKEAYTLRNFWGISWHQLLRRFLEGLSSFVSDSLFGLRKRTLVSRYTRLVVSFAISGFFHQATLLAQTVPWQESHGAMFFFLVQAAGIMVEDSVQELSQRANLPLNQAWRRWIGRIWLAAFLVWSTPTWAYAGIRLNIREPEFIFSMPIVGTLAGYVKTFE